jgi:hypothetical protein
MNFARHGLTLGRHGAPIQAGKKPEKSSASWLGIGQNDELLFKMAQISTMFQAEANRLVTT